MKITPNFDNLIAAGKPFRYFTVSNIFDDSIANNLSGMLENLSTWLFVQTDFYKQFETSAFDLPEDNALRALTDSKTVEAISGEISRQFNQPNLTIADVTLHRLIAGHSIGIHNDFIANGETHRLVIHLSRNWEHSNGGYFVVFSDSEAENVSTLVKPVLNSAIGFEISEASNHAVSKVSGPDRYSVVFSFTSR